MPKLSDYYLMLYNTAQCAGWAFILYHTNLNLLDENNTVADLWNKVSLVLLIFQNAAVLEVVHSLVGFVPSHWFTTLLQIVSRIFIASFICYCYEPPREHLIFTIMMEAWSITEVVRYGYYFLSLVTKATGVNLLPYPLKYLRYSMFLVLYPLGVFCEMSCIVISMIFIKKNGLWIYQINDETSVDLVYLLVVVLLAYLPGLPKLYGHMKYQRKKQLYPETIQKKGGKKATKPKNDKKNK
eukprot:TRINITY_DN115_c1_g1_i1.p1 TRINITY_DN115_c1_g1~~TRINITY_DN115_c1_g1_i1.p1  ORF type:complete len:240 (+),score=57.79 TRINITY_DN115_c1_g1_i1:77-796(+)